MSEERKRDAGAYAPTPGPLGGPTLPHDSAAAPLARAGTRRRAVIGGVIAGLAIAGSITAAVVVTRRDTTPSRQPSPQPVVTEVVADARGVDAAVLATAAVITLVPGDAAPQDARTVIAHRDPRPNPARAITLPAIAPAIPPPVAPPPVTAGSSAPPPQLTIITAWSGRTGLPAAANPKDPAHRAVLAATIRDLGLDGFDPKATTDGIDPTDVLETAIAHIKIGMIERRRGHCDKAIALWTDAKAALHPDLEPVWAARASMGIALCTLAAGKPVDAENAVHGVWLSGNQDETRLVMALTHYESGDLDTSFGLFLVANRLANPRVQDAIKIWVAGTGLTLP